MAPIYYKDQANSASDCLLSLQPATLLIQPGTSYTAAAQLQHQNQHVTHTPASTGRPARSRWSNLQGQPNTRSGTGARTACLAAAARTGTSCRHCSSALP
eukprot:948685-Rhodomonas_salina.1